MAETPKPRPAPTDPPVCKGRHLRPHGRPEHYHVRIDREGEATYATCLDCKARAAFIDGVAALEHADRCPALGLAA